ncbi:unnamed protein product, partial [Prorocentrum cordatum]
SKLGPPPKTTKNLRLDFFETPDVWVWRAGDPGRAPRGPRLAATLPAERGAARGRRAPGRTADERRRGRRRAQPARGPPHCGAVPAAPVAAAVQGRQLLEGLAEDPLQLLHAGEPRKKPRAGSRASATSRPRCSPCPARRRRPRPPPCAARSCLLSAAHPRRCPRAGGGPRCARQRRRRRSSS